MADTRTAGERIAGLRKTYNISQEVLAERSGLSVESIARIETEGYLPDLAPLVKLSRALGVRLGTLLDDHEELGPLVTRAGAASEGVRFVTGQKTHAADSPTDSPAAPVPGAALSRAGLSFKALAAGKGGRHMEPFTVDLSPDAAPALSTHEGEEFLFILSGTVMLEYGSETYELNQGDSVYYDSIVPHRVCPPKASAAHGAAAANGAAARGPAAAPAARLLAVVYTPA